MSSVEGLDELLANLSGLGGSINESSRKALERGAKKIQANAKYLAPVDTGHLRNSIKTRSEVTKGRAKAQVFTSLEYAMYVEFGTGKKGAMSNIDRPEGIHYKADWKGMPARPFLTPAYLHAKNTGEIEQEVIKSVQQDIKKLESGK